LINFRTLKDRNFCLCCAIIFCTFAILYSNTVSLPALLQSLFGYDATSSGLVLSPAGFFAIITLAIVGRLLGRGIDARYLMALGLAILAAGGYWMSRLNLDISPWQIVWPRVVFIIGLSAIFAPLNVAAFINIPPQLRGAAIGLLALLRNEGGSVGTSLAQTIQERRDQFHVLRLGENLDPLNPALNSYLEQAQPAFLQQTGDPVAAKQMALQSLANLRDQQSLALSYFDTFLIFALVAVALIGLVFLMKRAVAAKGAHVAAE
jgi:DHA2 family multidrug resistance protein